MDRLHYQQHRDLIAGLAEKHEVPLALVESLLELEQSFVNLRQAGAKDLLRQRVTELMNQALLARATTG